MERDPEYAALLDACLGEVEALGHADARQIDHREAFVFVSSPGSVTPYHIDPEWNFLLQVRGSKTITVFPAGDPSILSEVGTGALLFRGASQFVVQGRVRGQGRAVRRWVRATACMCR